ncbi:MAG: dipeptidase E [Clostridiales bacterium]|nr:dipeptidase E [Clostridiales bacterium]
MICYLASSPAHLGNTRLDPANGFVENLKRDLPRDINMVFVASDPDDYAGMEGYSGEMRRCFEKAGYRFTGFTVLDGRNAASARELVAAADIVFMAGGHVPTQNRFINAIGLRDILRDFNGMVMGCSAGTMNSADLVYAMPELDGEAIDPAFKRTLPGLGLTDINIVPHYQYLEMCTLDGMNMIHDIALSDSMTRRLYGLPDGSYLRVEGSDARLYGTVYLMERGTIRQICTEGASIAP